MQDDLLTQLLNASSEEEKAYLLAMALIETQPPDIREAVIAAAVPHWFDAEILAALLTEKKKSGFFDKLRFWLFPAKKRREEEQQRSLFKYRYQTIRDLNLPFVQPFGEIGLTLHDLTRAGIRAHLFKHDLERFKTYSRRTATYFAEQDEPQYRVEGIYHQLIENDLDSRYAFWDQMETYCSKQFDLSAANMLLVNLNELISTGILRGNEVERLLGVGYGMLGDLQQNRGILSATAESYQKAVIIFERLTRANRSNSDVQRDLLVSYNRLCNISRQLGNLNTAQQSYQRYFEIADRQIKAAPFDMQAQHDLSIRYRDFGDIAAESGDLNTAQQAYQKCHNILKRLVQITPSDTQIQKNFAISYERIGNINFLFSRTDIASDAYRQCQKICNKLINMDASDIWTQRELSITYNKFGDIAIQSGDLNTALHTYQQSFELRKSLVQADPANAQAQKDLAVIYERIGNIHILSGNALLASDNYQKCQKICKHLLEIDHGDIGVQRKLSISYNKLGRVEELLNHTETAYHLQEHALSIVQKLFDKDPQSAIVRNNVVEYKSVLERLHGDEALARGETQAALAAYQRAFDLSRQVAEEQPLNLDALRDTYWNSYKIGVAFAALGQAEQARDAFRNALALAEPFASQPENVLAQRDMAAIRRELQG